MNRDFVALMYHELERPGRALCDEGAGYTRYVISETTFAAHLSRLKTLDLRGQNLSQTLESGGLAVTFDDGCESDLAVAAPLLQQAGFGATFYLVSGWIGRRGFLSEKQVIELADAGFEIGSHGQTHAFLSDLPDAGLRAELRDSKAKLEDLIGREVAHFSCPGGRFDARLAPVAKEFGYASVATSRAGINGSEADLFSLKRMAITKSTGSADFERACRGQLAPRDQMRGAALRIAKAVLGNGAYQKMRGAALEKSG